MLETNLFGIFAFKLSYLSISIIAGLWAVSAFLIINSIRKPKFDELSGILDIQGGSTNVGREDIVFKSAYGKIYNKYLKNNFESEGGLFASIVKQMQVDSEELNRKLSLVNSELSAEEFISIKIILMISGAVLGLAGIYSMPLMIIGVFVLIMGISGLESSMITDKIKKRTKEFERDLPNFLDLLYSSCKAGHTITEAIRKVSTKYSGIVAQEFSRAMVETKGNGGDFRKAMNQMAERNDIEFLSDVISDILISFEKGDEQIINTLKNEADNMRDMVNASIEETANRKSSTLIFPMLIFSFVPLFAFLLIPLFSQFQALF